MPCTRQVSAPGIYVSGDAGKWTVCKTSHSQNSVDVAAVADKIKECAAASPKPAKKEL